MDTIAVHRRIDSGLLSNNATTAADVTPAAVRPFPKGKPPGRSHNKYAAPLASETNVNSTIESSMSTMILVIAVLYYELKENEPEGEITAAETKQGPISLTTSSASTTANIATVTWAISVLYSSKTGP